MSGNERTGSAGENPRTVSVSGNGEVDLEPTMGRVSLGVNVVRRTADDAMDEAARLVEQLNSAIVASGIDKGDITTSRFSIRAEYEHSSSGRSRYPVGFRTSHTVNVLVRQIGRTGDVVGTAVNAGANSIDNVWFVAENYDEARRRARDLAFEDARQKAEQLAALAGARLGNVLMIDDGTPSPGGRYAMMSRDMLYSTADMPPPSAPSFSPEDLTISSSLSIVWALE